MVARYTEGAAYAGGQEGERGRIARGFVADLVALEGPLDAARPPTVAETWAAGQRVYGAPRRALASRRNQGRGRDRDRQPWRGQRVLVTGASSGIGAAIARDLAAQGATVGLVARREELLERVLADCRADAPASVALPFDLTNLDGLETLVQRAEEELGGIDVLVNNAGVTYAGPAASAPLDDLEAQLRINYLSPVRLTQLVVSAMTARGSGRVAAVSSMAARTSPPGEAAYASAKSALSTYVEALAGELWGGPVRFHLVYPALIDLTEGVDGDDELARSVRRCNPDPRPCSGEGHPAPARAWRLELYIPETMRSFVAGRGRDVAGAIEFMAALYREGRLH